MSTLISEVLYVVLECHIMMTKKITLLALFSEYFVNALFGLGLGFGG